MENITTYNGVSLPLLGFGTYKLNNRIDAITDALKTGYRLIDTAWIYGNEKEVAQAVSESSVKRKDIILATKVWPNYFGRDLTRRSLERSLKDLKTDYLDILYLHWPGEGQSDAWKVLEEAYEEGIVKVVAVSNFRKQHLDALSVHANIKPMLNQLELHPLLQERELRTYMEKEEILPVAYSPLARGQKGIFDGEIAELAKKYGKTPAQIVLRWHVEEGIIAIPKSGTKENIQKNFAIFDFLLTKEERAKLKDLDSEENRIGTSSLNEKWLNEIRSQAL